MKPAPVKPTPVDLKPSVRILGIDPGSQRTGVGIVDADGSGQTQHVFHDALFVAGEEDFPRRLKAIVVRLTELIVEYRPDEVAIERVFMAKNPDSALKLGQARGAAICAAVLRDLPVHEYSPMQIKQAVVGRGSAEKTQVQHMVGVLLGVQGKLQADAADALAVAITHAHSRGLAARTGVLASAAAAATPASLAAPSLAALVRSALLRRRGSRR